MDIKKIKAIVELVKESGIAELEITEGEEKLRISAALNTSQLYLQQHSQAQHHNIANHAAFSSTQHTENNTVQSKSSDLVATSAPTVSTQQKYITSPMVGTFYSSSSPNTPPFVDVGQNIKMGQILCIIEAMKLMNQIESDQDGVIKEILVKDGEPVEFGQQLFVIE